MPVARRRFMLLLLFWPSVPAFAQQTCVLSGTVRDARSGETLIGAVVATEDRERSAGSNAYGFYSLTLPSGKNRVSVSYVGYAAQILELDMTEGLRRDIDLVPEERMVEEVSVSGRKKDANVSDAQMGALSFRMEELRNIPVIFGERDLLKTIQLLPGVQSGGEGSTGFFVRGGGADQNLVLLDEATVYNAAHLLGFFSTFNSDAIKDVQLYKGGIPAQFGGRISSVLDIAMLDGNKKRFTAEGGLGLIASRLKVEAPLVRDKSSFMLSGRRTYIDMFLKLSDNEEARSSKIYFYDINGKADLRLDGRNRLYLSGYVGKDDFGYANLFLFDWGNTTANLRWNHIFNERLFGNTSLIYSDFAYNIQISTTRSDFKVASKLQDWDFQIASKIRNWNLKQDFSYYPHANSTLRFGLSALRQRIRPAALQAAEGTSVSSKEVDSRQGIEAAAYLSHEWKPTRKLSLLYGLRLTDFMVMGPGTFYAFDDDGDPVAEERHPQRILRHYFRPEPRFSASFLLGRTSSVKASYNRIVQNLHQLTNTTSSLPTDQYTLSSLNIRPQLADQFALGYFRNFRDNGYAFSVEAYHKHMGGQIDFRNGADLQANAYFEGSLLQGIGRAYGVEWHLRKDAGRINGWISYTLSKSERQFGGINGGRWFNARQDRTHDLSVVGLYGLSEKWTLGATFVFNTGTAVTFPSGKYEMGGTTRFYYSERNAYRMPDYHRMDLSASYEPNRGKRKWQSGWTFGLYNVYNRRNAYIIDFRESPQTPNVAEAYKIALFGIIPSVAWNFGF